LIGAAVSQVPSFHSSDGGAGIAEAQEPGRDVSGRNINFPAKSVGLAATGIKPELKNFHSS
jgi:hypothetical protein